MSRAPHLSGQSSDKSQRSPINAEQFALAGPTDLPDSRFHAFRKDLADIALAGRVIASHYAEPVERLLSSPADLRSAPDDDAALLLHLPLGSMFALLDDSRDWAWGYAGDSRLVGYIRSAALA